MHLHRWARMGNDQPDSLGQGSQPLFGFDAIIPNGSEEVGPFFPPCMQMSAGANVGPSTPVRASLRAPSPAVSVATSTGASDMQLVPAPPGAAPFGGQAVPARIRSALADLGASSSLAGTEVDDDGEGYVC